MAKYDHGSSQIADSYAKTLLELTEGAGTTGDVVEEFREFVEFMQRETAMLEFLTSRAIDSERRAAVMEKHFRGRMNDLLLNTLQVINRRDRSALVPLIYERYRLAVEDVRNEIDVHVTSAVPLNDALRQELSDTAGRLAGKTPRLVERVDPAIIGGLVVRIGDEKLDNSVARRLTRLGSALDERTTLEIHSGRAFFQANVG